MTLCGIVEDLDEWFAGGRVQDTRNVARCEGQGHDHEQSENCVRSDGPDDRFWQGDGGIFDLLGYSNTHSVSGCTLQNDARASNLHMCTEQSYPINTFSGVTNPIIAESPVVGQPPLFWKSSSATCAGARGAITQSGTMMAKMPHRCKTSTMPSMRGSRTARKVLNMIEDEMTAIVSRVACHLCGTYVSSFKAIKPWMMPPTIKHTPARYTCHPIAQSQPVESDELGNKVAGMGRMDSYQQDS